MTITLIILAVFLIVASAAMFRFWSPKTADDRQAAERRTANIALAISFLSLALTIVEGVAFFGGGGVRNAVVGISSAAMTIWLWRTVLQAHRTQRRRGPE